MELVFQALWFSSTAEMVINIPGPSEGDMRATQHDAVNHKRSDTLLSTPSSSLVPNQPGPMVGWSGSCCCKKESSSTLLLFDWTDPKTPRLSSKQAAWDLGVLPDPKAELTWDPDELVLSCSRPVLRPRQIGIYKTWTTMKILSCNLYVFM